MASKPPEFDPQQMSEQMKQSAQQIWQAGLGAFAKAQQEGGKVFESLVKEGSKLQETTLQAQAKVAEAAAKASAMASDMGQRASSQFDRLEGIFEERVAKALHQLGLPDAQDMAALQARVSALEAELQALKDSVGKSGSKG
ncbi:MAG: poly(hydroxyalkanoate) granule-associated protein [Betaproteobacteria bacterium]|nr:poly(hydroxyalkanoate) granule-associated protein [Betaproteobacteria bacterium]